MSRVGVIALARPTFDVAYAEEVAATAFGVLDQVAPGWLGTGSLLFDEAGTASAVAELAAANVTTVVVLQVTFTDASMTKSLATAIEAPLVFWAFPEDRTGGRLRLNSLCGINLAAYSLRRDGHRTGFMFLPAEDPRAPEKLALLIAGGAVASSQEEDPLDEPSTAAVEAAAGVVAALDGMVTGVIGAHPTGFDPCEYDPAQVRALTGVTVQRIELPVLFAAAESAPTEEVASARGRASSALGSLDDLDQEALDRSLRLYSAMRRLAAANNWSAFATRCWPECFTEYGSAACAPQAMMTDDGIPGGCEADVYGSLTSLVLQQLAGEPAFVADLVDLDVVDDTAVFWHCGVAPLHMADPAVAPAPTIHSNRRLPLLHEFPLKPGRVTIARVSRSGGSHRLVIGGGEMVRASLPFSGTAGVFRPDVPATTLLGTVLAEGLEHHYGIVYGDYREELRALATKWDIPVVRLT